MTENITVTHLTDQPQPDASGVDLVRVPAADVVIENNVRTAADLDPAFLASVKQHGVLLPTIGYRNADGAVVVRDGQMRVLAACEAAVAVPVFVTARDDSTAKRIAEQLVANERRTALTDGDRLAAYRQLEIEGLSVTAIARETGTKRDAVKQTLTVAKSDAAATAVASGQATFTQALILSEFDGDADALAALNEAISEGYDEDELTHYAAELRQDRERRDARAKVLAELVAEGKRVVEDDDYDSLDRLTDAADDVTDYTERHPLDPEAHAECAGVAWTVSEWGDPGAGAGVHHSRRPPPPLPRLPRDRSGRWRSVRAGEVRRGPRGRGGGTEGGSSGSGRQ
ncbi:hypothetical protein [Curtobacterium flaccumfaciens]|nr:hypothetical protein [Curtobacterium flaccumfaciens]UWD85294.1 hypothetical protein NY059_13270 [Curtobacterium flaccumfaciens pv. betae]